MSKTKTRALTVHQPYATSLVRGVKPIENRSQPTRYSGWLLIHAGVSTVPDDEARLVARLGGPPDPTAVPRGAFVGAITIADCHRAEDCREPVDVEAPGVLAYGHCSPWAHPSGWHWIVDRSIEFDDPLPARGKQGLWVPPASAIALLARTIGVDR